MPRRFPEGPTVLGDDIVQAIAGAVAPAELHSEQRNSLRARVLERATGVPQPDAEIPESGVEAPPPDTETIRGAGVPWRKAWPGVWIKVLKRDPEADFQIALMKLEPGGRIPGHPHRRNEECFVLEGEVLVGSHRVRAGDFHIALAGGHHPDLTSSAGALVMVRSESHEAAT